MEVELGSRSISGNTNIRVVSCGGKLCEKFEEMEEEQDDCPQRARGRMEREIRERGPSMKLKAMVSKVSHNRTPLKSF